jgi:hypothetical protein
MNKISSIAEPHHFYTSPSKTLMWLQLRLRQAYAADCGSGSTTLKKATNFHTFASQKIFWLSSCRDAVKVSLLSVEYVPSGWSRTCPAGWAGKGRLPLNQVMTAAGRAPDT